MSPAQKLKALRDYAFTKGWRGGRWLNVGGDWMGTPPNLEIVVPFHGYPLLKYTTGLNAQEYFYPPQVMLLDHSFVKALFGTEFNESVAQYIPFTGESKEPKDMGDWYGKAHYNGPTYQYHLMMVAIIEDPNNQIDYMHKMVFNSVKG